MLAGLLPLTATAPPALAQIWTGRVLSNRDGTSSFVGRFPVGDRQSATAIARHFVTQMVGVDLPLRLTSHEPLRDGFVARLAQLHQGVRVRDGHLTLVVRKRAVVTARFRFVPVASLPKRVTPRPGGRVDGEIERLAVADYLRSEVVAAVRGELEIVRPTDDTEPVPAWQVSVVTADPPERWWIWIEDTTRRIVRRERRSADQVQGTVQMSVDADCQDQGTEMRGMPHVEWAPGRFADAEGTFETDEAIDEANVSLASPYFRLRNAAGEVAGPWRFDLAPSPAINELQIEPPLEQSTPFYHAHAVRDWMRSRLEVDGGRQKRWSEQQVTLNVNIGQTCNATYNGEINFFRAGNGCINTGRASTIVYHEYGHGIHDNSSDVFDGQVSEGIADFTAATIRNSPSIAGIRGCSREFRTCQNDLTYCSGGCDHGPGSPVHASGQVICAVWWELRTLLVERYGYDEGVSVTDKLFLDFLTAVSTMSSAYEATISVDEDDDGDPSNGTRHSCEINRAFANDDAGAIAHFPDLVGRIPSAPSVAISHQAPGILSPSSGDPLRLDFMVSTEAGCSPTNEAPTIRVVLAPVSSSSGEGEERVLDPVAHGDDRYSVDVSQLSRDRAYRYYIEVALAGRTFYYPNQARADVLRRIPGLDFPPYRQTLYIGDPEVLLSTDLESEDSGFVVSACKRAPTSTYCAPGARSDWTWWPASASTAGGPAAAHSGQGMWVTNPDGTYGRGLRSRLTLPPIDARDYASVRLQFWRFLVNADVASIEVNERRVFNNRAGAFFWRDPTWTFEDVDITPWAAGQEAVSISFIIDDEFADTFELGGWHIDDVRVVGARATEPADPGQGMPEGSRRPRPSGCSSNGGDPQLWLLLPAIVFAGRRRGEKRT